MTTTFLKRLPRGRGDDPTAIPDSRYCLEENLEAMSFTAPTTRRQNMRKKPAIAAKTDARGIKESGPIYTRELS